MRYTAISPQEDRNGVVVLENVRFVCIIHYKANKVGSRMLLIATDQMLPAGKLLVPSRCLHYLICFCDYVSFFSTARGVSTLLLRGLLEDVVRDTSSRGLPVGEPDRAFDCKDPRNSSFSKPGFAS